MIENKRGQPEWLELKSAFVKKHIRSPVLVEIFWVVLGTYRGPALLHEVDEAQAGVVAPRSAWLTFKKSVDVVVDAFRHCVVGFRRIGVGTVQNAEVFRVSLGGDDSASHKRGKVGFEGCFGFGTSVSVDNEICTSRSVEFKLDLRNFFLQLISGLLFRHAHPSPTGEYQ